MSTPIDATLYYAGTSVRLLQTAIGIETRGRALCAQEREVLSRIFSGSVDFSRVSIKNGGAGLFSINNRPFVLGNTIYLKARSSFDVLVHEMVHVWQFQHGGTAYISKALYSQYFGAGYDWQHSVPEAAWGELEPEQQAQLIQDAYCAGAFDEGTLCNFVVGEMNYGPYLKEALVELRAGRGAP